MKLDFGQVQIGLLACSIQPTLVVLELAVLDLVCLELFPAVVEHFRPLQKHLATDFELAEQRVKIFPLQMSVDVLVRAIAGQPAWDPQV